MIRSQKELIKRVLVDDGRTLSSMEAFEHFGITRLAAVIFELRQEG